METSISNLAGDEVDYGGKEERKGSAVRKRSSFRCSCAKLLGLERGWESGKENPGVTKSRWKRIQLKGGTGDRSIVNFR